MADVDVRGDKLFTRASTLTSFNAFIFDFFLSEILGIKSEFMILEYKKYLRTLVKHSDSTKLLLVMGVVMRYSFLGHCHSHDCDNTHWKKVRVLF